MGHDAEDVAIGTKVNLQGQTAQVIRINEQVIEMRDTNIKESDALLGSIQEGRRKNKRLLCCVVTMMSLACTYVILVQMGKVASIFV